jgi:hypothetical protein
MLNRAKPANHSLFTTPRHQLIYQDMQECNEFHNHQRWNREDFWNYICSRPCTKDITYEYLEHLETQAKLHSYKFDVESFERTLEILALLRKEKQS